jgi:hypothetical protein
VIQTDEQLQRTREALLHVEAALAALHRQKAYNSTARFALMAEPVLDQLHEQRAQIDKYIGLSDTTTAVDAVVRANGGVMSGSEP